ncbi:MAG TPA: hypothetical protein VFW15_10840 [Thermoanaerobaculia bacterium]|nr:hypothetical protein [Thermoanaerobaculia bacterium]
MLFIAVLALAIGVAPALGKNKKFLESDDAREENEPAKYLPDYDKLTEGRDADWVYFPEGSLKKYRTVQVKDFVENGKGREAREAARAGREYMEQWLERDGYKLSEKGAELVIEGNIFNAWEPGTGARIWGGWMANPGVGVEVLLKDSSGKVVGEVRHKNRGSTIEDAVENALEEVAKAISDGR